MTWHLGDDGAIPPLPEPLEIAADRRGHARAEQLFAASRQLPAGCYRLRLTPRFSDEIWFDGSLSYDGTLRITWEGSRVAGSADLYRNRRPLGVPEPLRPADHPTGIPVHPRGEYRYYGRLVAVGADDRGRLRLTIELHLLDGETGSWSLDGVLELDTNPRSPHWVDLPTPPGHGSAVYLEAVARNRQQTAVADAELAWISPWLRRASLEIDRVPAHLPYPGGDSFDAAADAWRRLFQSVGLHFELVDCPAPPVPAAPPAKGVAEGQGKDLEDDADRRWTEIALHDLMLERRSPVDLDQEWRHYLVCVETFVRNPRSLGVMFDYNGYGEVFDRNAEAREGAAVFACARFRDERRWGPMAGRRLLDSAPLYLRTAVHEIGHAMNLQHDPRTPGFMLEANIVAGAPGNFPDNIPWHFSERDTWRLRHQPDPWMRPGGVPWAFRSAALPVPLRDLAVPPEGVAFEVRALHAEVPLGAPLRLELELRGSGDRLPNALSLKDGTVRVVVHGPTGRPNPVPPVAVRLASPPVRDLAVDHLRASLVLVCGKHGSVLAAPGTHRVEVEVCWGDSEREGYLRYALRSRCSVVATPPPAGPIAASSAIAAGQTLLRVVARLGTPTLEDLRAIEGLLGEREIEPHLRWIAVEGALRRPAADRLGQLALLHPQVVMSESEGGDLLAQMKLEPGGLAAFREVIAAIAEANGWSHELRWRFAAVEDRTG